MLCDQPFAHLQSQPSQQHLLDNYRLDKISARYLYQGRHYETFAMPLERALQSPALGPFPQQPLALFDTAVRASSSLPSFVDNGSGGLRAAPARS